MRRLARPLQNERDSEEKIGRSDKLAETQQTENFATDLLRRPNQTVNGLADLRLGLGAPHQVWQLSPSVQYRHGPLPWGLRPLDPTVRHRIPIPAWG